MDTGRQYLCWKTCIRCSKCSLFSLSCNITAPKGYSAGAGSFFMIKAVMFGWMSVLCGRHMRASFFCAWSKIGIHKNASKAIDSCRALACRAQSIELKKNLSFPEYTKIYKKETREAYPRMWPKICFYVCGMTLFGSFINKVVHYFRTKSHIASSNRWAVVRWGGLQVNQKEAT